LLDQAIFVEQQPRTIAHHHHIVMERASVNGAWVLADKHAAVQVQLSQACHGHAGFIGLPSWKSPWQIPLWGIMGTTIDKEMPPTVGRPGPQPAVIGRAFVAQHGIGWQRIVHDHPCGVAEEMPEHRGPCRAF
jgi:hypothetical protein